MLTNISLVYHSRVHILYLFVACDFAFNYDIIEYGVKIAPTLVFEGKGVTQPHFRQPAYLSSHYTPRLRRLPDHYAKDIQRWADVRNPQQKKTQQINKQINKQLIVEYINELNKCHNCVQNSNKVANYLSKP